MAGHSHASNVKHKKDHNNRLKSEFFLKIRRKIELTYNNTNDKEKVFSIAKKYNFPKEKVSLIIEKIENSRCQNNSFADLLYRGKYETLVYLRGNLSDQQNVLLEENIKALSLEKLHSKRLQDCFYPMYLLKISSCENVEGIILSSLSALVVDKIIKIEEKGKAGSNEFEILFSEREALAETIEFFTGNLNVQNLESREIFIPFFSIYENSDDFLAYFFLLEDSFSKLGKNLQIFTNISGKEKWDHSSVG